MARKFHTDRDTAVRASALLKAIFATQPAPIDVGGVGTRSAGRQIGQILGLPGIDAAARVFDARGRVNRALEDFEAAFERGCAECRSAGGVHKATREELAADMVWLRNLETSPKSFGQFLRWLELTITTHMAGQHFDGLRLRNRILGGRREWFVEKVEGVAESVPAIVAPAPDIERSQISANEILRQIVREEIERGLPEALIAFAKSHQFDESVKRAFDRALASAAGASGS